jgi:hypothetical protein
MHFTSIDSVVKAWNDVPAVLGQFRDRSNIAFVVGALIGGAIQLVRDRWLAAMLLLIVAVNIFFFTNYVGDLDHYLLVTWLVFAVWLAIALEAVVGWLERRVPRIATPPGPAVLALVLPIVIAGNNWAAYDASRNHDGDNFARAIFDQLPRDAVLLSYWDALTNLGYEHCVEGRRPDVALRSLDEAARIVCDPIEGSLEDVARVRPLYAFFVASSELDAVRGSFDLVPVRPRSSRRTRSSVRPGSIIALSGSPFTVSWSSSGTAQTSRPGAQREAGIGMDSPRARAAAAARVRATTTTSIARR